MGFVAGAAFAYRFPEVLRARSAWWRRSLAALSAAGAIAAQTHATGWVITDIALPAALAAAVVLFAFRAKPTTVAVIAVLTAAAATGSHAQPVALATAGLAIATALTARRGPTATALVGLGVVNAALRFDLPDWVNAPQGTTALIAALLLIPLAYSGYRRMRAKDQHWVRRAAFVLTVVGGMATAAGAVALAEARPSLERGIDAATKGLDQARKADSAGAQDSLARANDSFATASSTMHAAWARPGLLVPVIAQHVRVLRAVSDSGTELATAGLDLADSANLDRIQIVNGQVPLDAVAALRPQLARAEGALGRSHDRLAADRTDWLVPPIRNRLDSQLTKLDDARGTAKRATQAVDVLPDLLGANGPRRWFLAVMTPVEARSAGGFIGNFGEIATTDGKIELTRFGRTRELNEGGNQAAKKITGPPDFLARYDRFAPEVTWQNVTLSPDFPTVADVIGQLYPQSGGLPVDGAIGIDPTGLAAILEITGPVVVKGWDVPFTAENIEQTLLYDQYIRYPNEDRPELLGDAAETIFKRLTSTTLPSPTKILNALGPAVAGRHLQIAVTPAHADNAGVLDDLGVDGAFPEVEGDFFSVTTQNASASKIEYFLRREITYKTTVKADGTIAATATVTLRNTAPTTGLPRYLIGNAVGLPPGSTRLYVSLYSPWALTGARLDGQPTALGSERELGRMVYSGFFDIPAGGTATLEVDLAGTVPPAFRGDDYRLTVHHQPTVAPDELTVVRNGTKPIVLSPVTDIVVRPKG